MPIYLNLNEIKILTIPDVLGKQRVLKKLMDSLKEKWEAKIIEDYSGSRNSDHLTRVVKI